MEQSTWSFSSEWKEFNERGVEKTWIWTLPVRTAMFFREIDMSPEDLADKRVLDAGCGNGQLTNAIGQYAREVVGFDYSESVEYAEKVKTHANVRYMRGDLNNPSLDPESFDVVYSSGVLHHNPDTEKAFKAVARLVKPGGRFYCWLYRVTPKPIPLASLAVNEPIRWVVSRLPPGPRKAAVRAHAGLYHAVLSLVKPGKYTYDEHVIAVYDAIACRHAHRHSPFEMAKWFHEVGFDSPKLTHWDNESGFGMVAVKQSKGPAAGVNFRID